MSDTIIGLQVGAYIGFETTGPIVPLAELMEFGRMLNSLAIAAVNAMASRGRGPPRSRAERGLMALGWLQSVLPWALKGARQDWQTQQEARAVQIRRDGSEAEMFGFPWLPTGDVFEASCRAGMEHASMGVSMVLLVVVDEATKAFKSFEGYTLAEPTCIHRDDVDAPRDDLFSDLSIADTYTYSRDLMVPTWNKSE
jgi:hypothetical protein